MIFSQGELRVGEADRLCNNNNHIVCHSGFISESNSFNNFATLEIPKQVRDDNYDTAC